MAKWLLAHANDPMALGVGAESVRGISDIHHLAKSLGRASVPLDLRATGPAGGPAAPAMKPPYVQRLATTGSRPDEIVAASQRVGGMATWPSTPVLIARK